MTEPVAAELIFSILLIAGFSITGIFQTFWLQSNLARSMAIPIDMNATFRGKRVLGPNKTIRGLLVFPPCNAIVFAAIGYFYNQMPTHLQFVAASSYGSLHWMLIGMITGITFMLGELPNSFVKRQLGVPAGGMPKNVLLKGVTFVVDQLDSILAATLVMCFFVDLSLFIVVSIMVLGALIHWLFNLYFSLTGFKNRAA